MNTHPEQWAAMLRRPGSSWGFGALLKDTSVVVLKEERALVIHSPINNPCRTWDSNPQPLDYKSDSLTITPRLPQSWLTLFVEGVNVRLLDHCQVSSLLHYCGFKEQEIPRIYTVWMVINWNSNVNILIFWDTDFWLSWAVSSNHQN